jgi:hypothetical protein
VRGGEHHNTKHGHRRNGSHGSPEYRAWQGMIWRCHCATSGAYHAYGGKGLRVADEWRGEGGFVRFLAHVGPKPSARHSLDRKDGTRGYEPGNVRWATPLEQNLNRDVTRTLTVGGVTKPVIEWARKTGLEYATVLARVNRGWPAERCLEAVAPHAAKKGNPRAGRRARSLS